MKYPLIYRFLFLTGIYILITGCAKQTPPPAPLTYTGDQPRVQEPLSPEASQTHIQLPEGFSAELFAAEPDIINPIAFTWDERGRLWVVQSNDYPHKLANDVGGDRITICEDTDGDGKADKFIDFATNQSLTTGITLAKGGAIVCQAPEMVFLEDSNGDDKVDKRTVLFDGFGTWDTHAGPSNLKYGIDNMIWGAVGYSGFKNTFQGRTIEFKMGVYRFEKDGSYFEPVGQFNNNTWGLGFNENFETFGSTANNNHCCYVGIPLRYYDYLKKNPSWALNADFIQGHYEIHSVDSIPLQQVDVRGGYTAASGANFYLASNYPKEYRNQMYVCEPTGHLIHIARIENDGAGYKEVDGGNIFASTDAWTAPVYTETGPDGNLWVADWYNPVIQHNPDKRGMDNQIWNDDKGEGNAHLNKLRDYQHGRIYRIIYKKTRESHLKSLDPKDDVMLTDALQSDNIFWRTTAQRLIVEGNKTSIIPELIDLAKDTFRSNIEHILWTLDGLSALDGTYPDANAIVQSSLSSSSFATIRAALSLLPISMESSETLALSGLLTHPDHRIRLASLLKAGQLPESGAMFNEIEKLMSDETNTSDKWISAALKIYFREQNNEIVDPDLVEMILPTAQEKPTNWLYTTTKPTDDWMKNDFDDSKWSKGDGMFGGENEDDAQTRWVTDDIWMRKEIYLQKELIEPVVKLIHDNDYEVYINGSLLISGPGATTTYKYIKLGSEKGELFNKGKNVVAVHCVNSGGDQRIDMGIGRLGEVKTEVTFVLNTVNQKMAYDKTVLKATAGQTIEIVLNNKDQMLHNLVLLQPGSLESFGGMVDEFLTNPQAKEMDYIPSSKYVLGSTGMVEPGSTKSVVITLPEIPGVYPFVCTFPGHWTMMQGIIIVTAPGSYISENKDAPHISAMGGGGSHDFLKYFGQDDGKIISDNGHNNFLYTEDSDRLGSMIPGTDILFLTNNKPFTNLTKKAIMQRVNEGKMDLLIFHPGTWYNWLDWPEYNKLLVGGGSRSHEPLQEFEVKILKPNHPIMEGVPQTFRIIDELYRWEKDPDAEIEVLAEGRGFKSGEKFPVVWIVKHPKAKIVANTLGHDDRAHSHRAYQTILKNSTNYLLSGIN